MERNTVYRVVADALCVPVDSVTVESALNHHPAWDSLAHVAVILALEREFGIVVDDSAVLKYSTMAEILTLASPCDESCPVSTTTQSGKEERVIQVAFTSFDGMGLAGTLETPRNSARGRALLIHGMTADREEWGFFTQLAERLGESGIASLRIDYRCHGQAKGLASTELSLCGIVNDIDAAYSALLSAVPGEALATFLVGVSFGGGVSAFWAKRHPSKVRVLFLCAPVLDYIDDFDKTCTDWRKEISKTGTFTYVDRKLSRGIVNEAPYLDGRNVMADPPMPVVIFHGGSDSDVPIDKSRYYASLSKKITLVEVPGADHGFVVPGDADAQDPQSQENYNFVFERLLARCQEELDA